MTLRSKHKALCMDWQVLFHRAMLQPLVSHSAVPEPYALYNKDSIRKCANSQLQQKPWVLLLTLFYFCLFEMGSHFVALVGQTLTK